MDLAKIHRQLDKHYPDVLADLIFSYLFASRAELAEADEIREQQKLMLSDWSRFEDLTGNIQLTGNEMHDEIDLIVAYLANMYMEPTSLESKKSGEGWLNPFLTASDKEKLARAVWQYYKRGKPIYGSDSNYVVAIDRHLQLNHLSLKQKREYLLANYKKLTGRLPDPLVKSIPDNIELILDSLENLTYKRLITACPGNMQ